MIDRRQLLSAAPAAVGTLAVVGQAVPAAGQAAAPSAAGATNLNPPPVTRLLARFIVGARPDQLPPAVRREATRTFLNWAGAAAGGSRHATVDIAVRALAPLGGAHEARLLGRRDKLDLMNAAFVNGVSSHIFDFDDTHLATIIHPAGPVASAILAYAERRSLAGRPVSGAQFLHALALGVEVECRIGNAVYPNHYDVGWHITGTAGVFGAATAVAKLMALDEQRTIYALGLAASQPVGMRESFGSMNKSFNPGRAAANGLFAALLAEQGFTTSGQMIEAKRGWASTISTKQDWSQIIGGLGTHWEAALNTYKPFACGIVLHPIIDAAIQLRNANQIKPAQVARIDLHVNPLVLELTGKAAPTTGLEGKFSVFHATAIALITGAAGERQFSDAAVNDQTTLALRTKVFPKVDPAVRTEQADVAITLTDGRVLRQHVEHAIGSLERPMSDKDLETKFSGLAEGILPPAQLREAIATCWRIEQLTDASALARVCSLA